MSTANTTIVELKFIPFLSDWKKLIHFFGVLQNFNTWFMCATTWKRLKIAGAVALYFAASCGIMSGLWQTQRKTWWKFLTSTKVGIVPTLCIYFIGTGNVSIDLCLVRHLSFISAFFFASCLLHAQEGCFPTSKWHLRLIGASKHINKIPCWAVDTLWLRHCWVSPVDPAVHQIRASPCISIQWTSPAGDSCWSCGHVFNSNGSDTLTILIVNCESISEEYSIVNSESISEEYFMEQKIGGNTKWLYSHFIDGSGISIALSLLESRSMKFWCFPSCFYCVVCLACACLLGSTPPATLDWGFSHGEGIFRHRIRVPSYKRACVVDLVPLFLTIMHRPVLSNLIYSDPWNGCIRSYIFCFVLHFEGAGTLQRRKKCGFYSFARCISYSVVTNQDWY